MLRGFPQSPMTSAFGKLAPGFSSRLNLLVDVLWLVASVFLANWWTHLQFVRDNVSLPWLAVALMAVWLITATALRHYDPWAEREVLDDVAFVSILVLAVTTILALVSLAAPTSVDFPRVPQFLVVVWPVLLVLRVGLFRHLAQREGPLDEVLVVGTGPMGRITADDIIKRGKRTVVGFLRFDDETAPENLRAPLLGTASEFETLLRTTSVSEVYIAGSSTRHASEMQATIKVAERFGLPFALPAYSFRLDRARPVASKAIVDGYLHYITLEVKPSQMAIKRLFDIASSGMALWILLPLLGTVSMLIKITSRGPIFFKQQRVGIHGKPFNMLKFRSMVVNAEELKAKLEKLNEQSGPVFKMKNDPRITALGRFIRKYSIDELPQLINVLRGDMSIVGPRPPVPPEVAKYEPWQRRRLSVRPGLTCIWQVSGRNQISFEQWMYLDMQYIDHWSLRSDINLILKTFPVVFTGRGAS